MADGWTSSVAALQRIHRSSGHQLLPPLAAPSSVGEVGASVSVLGWVVASEVGAPLGGLGVSGADDGDVRRRFVDLAEVVGGELDRRRADVFFQPADLGGAG